MAPPHFIALLLLKIYDMLSLRVNNENPIKAIASLLNHELL